MSELNKDTYNLVAQNYKADHGKQLTWLAQLEEFRSLLSNGARIVDLGCGPGPETHWLATNVKGSQVTGVDFAVEMIRLAQRDSPENAELFEADIAHYAHPQLVDGIWARASLHHLNDDELVEALTAASQYLKQGGILYAINKHGKGETTERADKYGQIIHRYFNFFNEEKMASLAEETGFEIACQNHRTDDGQEWLISILRR